MVLTRKNATPRTIRHEHRAGRRAAPSFSKPRPKKSHVTIRPKLMTSTPYRQWIENEWNKRAREAGVSESAMITFVNEVDNEAVPPEVDVLFTYLERNYIYDIGIPEPGTLVGCRRDGGAGCPRGCFSTHGHQRNIAYTSQGLFKFNTYSKIIECNENCTCPTSCINRVAQRPRRIPIEIFKTESRGWGVRTSVALVRGQVLGLYTGLLIRRQKASKLLGERASYIFQLDIDEDPGDNPDDAYSVDALRCGNWTRFINHSCSPNTKIIAVAYDTMIEENLPYYLAFVATENISPGIELTLDYNPAEQEAWELKKYKEKSRSKKLKNMRQQKRCLCGARDCREWIAVVA
ncbi:SET domain-containing protein [Mycena olivaceomarginata]|nr:SET domain-containing protein [Mycena olivaceomarginata]